jgi:antitoxin (DNA-binding transcriptional repressor) of toxin-antitoxin stability system
MQQVTPDEAKARLTELIAAALRGERVVIAEDDQHAVQLVPTTAASHARHAGTARGMIVMSDDFDASLTDFAEYSARLLLRSADLTPSRFPSCLLLPLAPPAPHG